MITCSELQCIELVLLKNSTSSFYIAIIIIVFLVHSEHYNPSRNIVLVGFMGAGKSTVGRELAKIMRREFYDLDEVLTLKVGDEIFQKLAEGEEGSFRQVESRIALELLSKNRAIVAYGGGTIQNPNLLAQVLTRSFLVYLKADFETIWQRIKNSNLTRPLVDRLGRNGLERLLDMRSHIYEQSHFIVFTDSFEPPFIAKVIKHAFLQ